MPKVQVVNMQGAAVGEIELSDNVFGITPNVHVLHSAVVSQLASERRGTQSALLRGEVRGGGRKPWRQKGTGRARSGSTRSPLWRGGGVIFAPKPRKYGFKLPKKVRRLALYSALSSKVLEQQLIVLDALSLSEVKTREIVKVLKALNVDKKAIIVMDNADEAVLRSARNIEGVKAMDVAGMNIVDLLNHDILVMTKAAVTKAEEVLA
ncbi:50S ribosomal protein L4 [Desulfosporosinus sp. HMP52]|uniref:Large ribosomal subunit protein uL4 n=1 Tax=Desulfosporosinus hippei DSM 8344 TaxID=1121419 RepID=A0A1G8DK41_9FIRM|nr:MULTISPECIES: 50S ribosomal protein L4 [Desulfosporosinus]KGK91014.1 50S ribosomal protein L4 [Desulfosporosinus sp. HMP52]SDH58038.1 large subunit ribosomal protein L4 [Desulfosporosinus hippei DSM 8344]